MRNHTLTRLLLAGLALLLFLPLTQVQAAALADMSQGDWSALERGYQLPGLGRLERVARALKCGVGDLLGSA